MPCLYCGETVSREYYDIDPHWWYTIAKRHADGSCTRDPRQREKDMELGYRIMAWLLLAAGAVIVVIRPLP